MVSTGLNALFCISFVLAQEAFRTLAAEEGVQNEEKLESAPSLPGWNIKELSSIQETKIDFPHGFLKWIATYKLFPRSDPNIYVWERQWGEWLQKNGGPQKIFPKLPEFFRTAILSKMSSLATEELTPLQRAQNSKRLLLPHEFSALVDRVIALGRPPRNSPRTAESWQEMEMQYWIQRYGGKNAFLAAVDPDRRPAVKRIFETKAVQRLNAEFKNDLEAFFDKHNRWPQNATYKGQTVPRAEDNLATKVAKRGGRKAVLETMEPRFRENKSLMFAADPQTAVAQALSENLISHEEAELLESFNKPVEVLARWMENNLRFPNQRSKNALEKRLGQIIMMRRGFKVIYPQLPGNLKNQLWVMVRGDPEQVIKKLGQKRSLTQHEEAVLFEARYKLQPMTLYAEKILELKRIPSSFSDDPREARLAKYVQHTYGSSRYVLDHLPPKFRTNSIIRKALGNPAVNPSSPGDVCRGIFDRLSQTHNHQAAKDSP